MRNTKLLFYPLAAFLGITIFVVGVFFGTLRNPVAAEVQQPVAEQATIEETKPAVIEIENTINNMEIGFQGKEQKPLDEETKCLAMNIFYESRGEPVSGQLAVGLVTLNRVEHEDYPQTVCGVVYQNGQFSWTSKRPKMPRQSEAWTRAIEIAQRLMEDDVSDITHGATHFHTKSVRPAWGKKFELTKVVGNHIFYRKPVA